MQTTFSRNHSTLIQTERDSDARQSCPSSVTSKIAMIVGAISEVGGSLGTSQRLAISVVVECEQV